MKRLLLLSVFCVTLGVSAHHPVHISIVNMELTEKNNTLTYSVRLFQEDIIDLLGILIHEELHKGKTEQEAYNDTTLIPNYFKETINVFCDNRNLNFDLVNQVNQETEVWLYYSVSLESIPKEIEIENKIYNGIFPDQTNMLIFAYGKKEKAISFNSKFTRQRFNLNDI